MRSLSDLGNKISELEGSRLTYLSLFKDADKRLSRLASRKENIDKAAEIIRNVAEATQRKLQYKISELASMAEAAIFDDPYEVKIEFIQKRGQTEADIFFVKNGERVEPLSCTGHGPADIASFALRLSLWLLSSKRTRNTFFFDEPFKNLNGKKYQEATWKLVRKLADRLNLQFIIVTQIDGLEEQADKVFRVSQSAGVSVVSDLAKTKLKLTLRH